MNSSGCVRPRTIARLCIDPTLRRVSRANYDMLRAAFPRTLADQRDPESHPECRHRSIPRSQY